MHPSRSIHILALVLCCAAYTQAAASDPSGELLAAAARGDTGSVRKLLGEHAGIEARDKNGRTPLMLAAQHAHLDTVRFLLENGARADARDRAGWTAYGLTLLEPAGRGSHQDVLKALPKPPELRLLVNSSWRPANLVSSCFESRDRLLKSVGAIQLEQNLLKSLQAAASTAGKGVARIAGTGEDASEGDGVVSVEVQPGAACVNGSGDSLTFSIQLRVFRARDHVLLLEKSFGGGLKGMRSLTVTNVEQYGPVYETWIKPQAAQIYWAAVGALLRAEL